MAKLNQVFLSLAGSWIVESKPSIKYLMYYLSIIYDCTSCEVLCYGSSYSTKGKICYEYQRDPKVE